MEAVREDISAKEAIGVAFKIFEEFIETQKISNVLLEGIEYLDGKNVWAVTIGFDFGRVRTTGSPFTLTHEVTEPIRETRTIFLRAVDGEFVKMEKE